MSGAPTFAKLIASPFDGRRVLSAAQILFRHHADASVRRDLFVASTGFVAQIPSGIHCVKLMGQSLMAQDFDRQIAEIQIRLG